MSSGKSRSEEGGVRDAPLLTLPRHSLGSAAPGDAAVISGLEDFALFEEAEPDLARLGPGGDTDFVNRAHFTDRFDHDGISLVRDVAGDPAGIFGTLPRFLARRMIKDTISGSETLGAILISGVTIDLGRCPCLHEVPAIDDDNARGDREGVFRIVGHEQGGLAEALENVADLFAQLAAQGGIEVGKGFVEEKQLRLGRECPCKSETLPFASGKLVGKTLFFPREADELETGGDAISAGFFVLHNEAVIDIPLDSEVGKEGSVLKDETELARLGRDFAGDRLSGDDASVEEDLPSVGRLESGGKTQQTGLAAAALADEGDNLAAEDIEVDAINGGKMIPPVMTGDRVKGK